MNTNKFKLPLLLFDDECALCLRFKQGLEMIDRDDQIQKESLHNPEVYEAFPQLSPEQCRQAVHLIDEEGNIHAGGDVVVYLSRIVPGVSKFAWLLESERGRQASQLFYDKVNEYRTKYAKGCSGCSK